MDRKIMLGVGVAAAVGGAAAAAFAAYLVLKEDEGGTVNACEDISHTSSRPVSIDVNIHKKHIAHVIGKGGDTIKEIQHKTNTRIHFKDELETDIYRVCTINGQPDEAQLAEILIHQTIANRPRVETLVLMVPSRALGCIIGKNGENIRGMQNYSKCKIEVERNHGDGPKKVTLAGTADQIAVAKDLVEEKLLLVAERDQAKREKGLYAQKPNLNGGVDDHQRLSGLSVDDLDGTVSSKRLSESEDYRMSPRPSLLYLTSEEDPKSGDKGRRIEPNYQQEELLPTGGDKVIEVYVSSILNPSQFYVQKVGPQSVALDKLVQEMTTYYEITANQKLNEITKINSGNMVASQISSDNNWYRARVVNVIAPEDEYDESLIEVDIEFVDFGDCERKSITSVFKLLNDYLNLNFQAIECCLADVGPKEFHNPFNSLDGNESNNGWSEAAADDFEKLTHASHWKVILAKLKGYKNRASNKDRDEKNEESINRCSDSISSNPLNLSDIPDIPYVELVDINSEQVRYILFFLKKKVTFDIT